MKTLLNLFVIVILSLPICVAQTSAKKNKKLYVIFLHNKFLELEGLEGSHPEYGKVEYTKILETFKNKGFEVISEVRPRNASGADHAKKTSLQVDSLFKIGVAPEQITVIGTSKGGYIAMMSSALINNHKLNFVFIGCCSEEDAADNSQLNFSGHILSIYEKSDATTSCSDLMKRSKNKISSFEEVQLNTGLKHGYLYKAMKEWIDPTCEFATRMAKEKQNTEK